MRKRAGVVMFDRVLRIGLFCPACGTLHGPITARHTPSLYRPGGTGHKTPTGAPHCMVSERMADGGNDLFLTPDFGEVICVVPVSEHRLIAVGCLPFASSTAWFQTAWRSSGGTRTSSRACASF